MILSTPTSACFLCKRPLRLVGRDFTGKQIYKCEACEYLTTPADGDAVAQYDDPEYFDGWGCNLDFDYDRFEPAVHRQVNEYLAFLKQYTQGKSLLDVGTGSGLLLKIARDAGYEVEGTDLSKHVSETLPAKVGIPVHHGTIESIAFGRKYDIVTMLHVLEHTTDPLSTIDRAKEILSPGGFIIVVVPNYRSLDTRIKDTLSRLKLKSRPYKHLALGHHNFVFSIRSLERLGEKAGLRVVHSETRQPAWRAGGTHRLLEHYQLATWCWIVLQKEGRAPVGSQEQPLR
jgi:2-polyprenyl-3-methyl-5-hydroxy-6-metoxy-1,4-benzoquinol methylase